MAHTGGPSGDAHLGRSLLLHVVRRSSRNVQESRKHFPLFSLRSLQCGVQTAALMEQPVTRDSGGILAVAYELVNDARPWPAIGTTGDDRSRADAPKNWVSAR